MRAFLGEEPEKKAEIDAEAVSKGEGEHDETMPEPEESTVVSFNGLEYPR
jgi:hypothetical protein